MTIGGALSELDNLLKADDIPCYYKPSIKAVMDTIALNNSEKATSSTTKNDLGVDCISRFEVTEILNSEYDIDKMLDRVDELPSVTPIRPKGHWISHREHCEMNNLLPSGLGSYFWCSECDCGIDSKDFTRVNYNYCPNCGADMREVEE